MRRIVETKLRTRYGQFKIICYESEGLEGSPNFALVHGSINNVKGVLVRVQSECITGHMLMSLSCDCYEQLHDSLSQIVTEPCGALVYLRQEGRGVGLAAKLQSYVLQSQGLDTVDANLALGREIDERNYKSAASIIRELGIDSVRLLTNNPKKSEGLREGGVIVDGVVGLPPVVREENRKYLETKVRRMGHEFDIDS